MKNEKEIMVREYIITLDNNIEGPIENAIRYLKDLKEKHPEAQINVDTVYDDYENSYVISAFKMRPENSYEQKQRLARRHSNNERERDEYLRLKSKFEGHDTTK